MRENSTLRLLLILGFTGLLILPVGCRKAPAPSQPAPEVFKPYRFDDQFQKSATVSASPMPSSALMADPVVWHNFNSENDTTWSLLRGRVGFREGDLMVKGEGSTPVIMAPKETAIEWIRYEAVEIRMLAEGGKEIKIKVGKEEYAQKIGPLRQYNDYRFDVHINEPGTRPLLVMPTDGLFDLVAIQSIRLVPKKADFTEAAGRRFIGKREEYRNTLYVHSPAIITFEVPVPKAGHLHFGMGITEKNRPMQQLLIQQAVLRNYPNPERVGCPGTLVIRDLATRSAQLEVVQNEDWEHVTHCSPCYAEYLAITKKLRCALDDGTA